MNRFRSIRFGALAAALAMALPVAHAVDAPRIANQKINTSTMQVNGRYDRFIVTYRDGTTERGNRSAALQSVQAAVSRAGMDRTTRSAAALSVNYQRKLAIGADLVHTSRKLTQTEAGALMQQIAADPAVAHVEPDVMLHKVDDTPVVPNDPYYATYQWHFRAGDGTPEQIGSDTTSYANYGGSNVAKAWNLADGDGIVVAVLDTGITHHSDLDLSLADAGYDFITDHYVSGRATDGRVSGGWDLGDWTTDPVYDGDGGCVDPSQAEDSSWHGTHVSGTIAELTNNAVGMAGIANKAKVLPVRVLGHCGGYTSDIADGIVWASGGHVDGVPDNTNPAQVINMSLGGSGVCSSTDVTGQAISGAISRGVTVVVAAGNDNADAANYTPASCPGVITVASNGITGKRAFYSNWGNSVTLSAPGGGIYANDASSGSQAYAGFVWSTGNLGTHEPGDEGYMGMAGTSQATPHVSGIVALILSAERDASMTVSTPDQVRTLLASTARPFPVTPDQAIGAGIVDAYAALNKALGNVAPAEPTTPLAKGVTLTGQSGSGGTSKLYTLTVPAGAKNLNLRTFGGTGEVSMYVKAGSAPAADGSDADFKSARPGNTETVVIATPQATTYYVRVVGVSTYANLSVLGVYQ